MMSQAFPVNTVVLWLRSAAAYVARKPVVSTFYLTGATSMDVKDHQIIVYALSPHRCSPVSRLL